MEHLLVANIVLQYRHISKTDLWPPAVFYSLPGFTWYSLQPPQGRRSVRSKRILAVAIARPTGFSYPSISLYGGIFTGRFEGFLSIRGMPSIAPFQ